MSIRAPNPKTLMMYRRMLKSMQRVFAGDYEMFHRARIEMRKSIEASKDIEDQQKVAELLF
jgi:hypothetical protein